MKLVRLEDAKPYKATGHFNMTPLRLQHKDTTGIKSFWVGLSYFLPGGGVEMSTSDTEKVYVVLSGKITIITGEGKEIVLEPMDTLYIEEGDKRAIINKTNSPSSMLVISSYPREK